MSSVDGIRSTREERLSRTAPMRLNPFVLGFLYIGITTCWIALTRPSGTWLNWYITIMWSLYLPAALGGFARALLKGDRAIHRSTYAGVTRKRIIFVIPTVCRHDTLPGLKRVIGTIVRRAPRNLADWQLDIVIEEHAEGEDDLRACVEHLAPVQVVVVPRNYRTPRGAKYKGRANHYAAEMRRARGDAHAGVHVYHLDDDTHVGDDTIASIAEFVETKSGAYLLAQGILTFPHELSPSFFCRLADSIRPADDIMRCGLFTDDIGSPMGGMHGEHMLVRADIEEEIGWDFKTLVEDACFGLTFATRYPGRSCALHSFSYGASPACIGDLIKQRTRWAAGLFPLVTRRNGIPLVRKLPLLYMLLLWMTGPLYYMGVVVALAVTSGLHNTSPVALSAIFPWTFCLSYSIWQYLEGLKINAAVSAKRVPRLALSFIIVPLIYVFSPVEGYACWRGICRSFKHGLVFEVIKKEQ